MQAYKTKQGNWQLNYTSGGVQRTLYLGRRFDVLSAQRVARLVSELVTVRERNDEVSKDLLYRVGTLPKRIQSSLSRYGLVSCCFGLSLDELCEKFIESKKMLSAKTVSAYRNARKHLLQYFGCDCPVSDITKSAAELFVAEVSKTLSDCTVSRLFRRFRQFFKFAVEQGYISVNPFLFRSQRADTNVERQYYISHSTAALILQHCNDDRERLAFALGRFAGLRVPSELAGLRFCDFTGDVIRIAKDTKTGFREVPLFREVKEIFVRLSGKPDDLIFGNIKRSWHRNFLLSAIKKSGVQVWSKLWVNLRSSCITDLSKRGYDEKTLDAIFGNSAAVRRMHYIQFEKKAAYAKVLLDNEKSYVDGEGNVQSTCNQRDEIKELREDIQFLRKSGELTKR